MPDLRVRTGGTRSQGAGSYQNVTGTSTGTAVVRAVIRGDCHILEHHAAGMMGHFEVVR